VTADSGASRGLLTMALTAGLAVGCLLTEGRTSVESAEFPGVRIECTGEAVLGPNECLDWGESLLRGPGPASGKRVGQIVLTLRLGDARCGAEFFGPDGSHLASAAVRCPGR